MLLKAKFGVCSEIHTKQIPCDHNVEFFNVKPCGLMSNLVVRIGTGRLLERLTLANVSSEDGTSLPKYVKSST
jgi:hypothetical protein